MYTTIGKEASFELIEKKSRFIAHAHPISTEQEALDVLDGIRHEHAQARHNVYAYRLQGGRTRYSDDGEPAQTAGMPTLEVLVHAEVFDAIIVTTRYFGGVLLGTGGLVRAYTQAAQGALEQAGIVVIDECRDVTVSVGYALFESVSRLVERSGMSIISTDFSDVVTIVIRAKEALVPDLVTALTELSAGRASIELSDILFAAL